MADLSTERVMELMKSAQDCLDECPQPEGEMATLAWRMLQVRDKSTVQLAQALLDARQELREASQEMLRAVNRTLELKQELREAVEAMRPFAGHDAVVQIPVHDDGYDNSPCPRCHAFKITKAFDAKDSQ